MAWRLRLLISKKRTSLRCLGSLVFLNESVAGQIVRPELPPCHTGKVVPTIIAFMLIREATEADAVGIAQVVKQITEIRAVANVAMEDVAARIRDGLAKVSRSGTSTVLLGVTDRGEVASYCAVHWVPMLFLPGGEGYVTELFVRPSDRGKGLGSSLIGPVEEKARQRGCARLSLLNGRDGESYQRHFYGKRQWVERAQMANFILPLAS